MIVVKIEMWPGGSANRARDLGVIEIANTGGDHTHGDYDVRLQKSPEYARRPGIWKRGAVQRFPRMRLGPYDLLLRGLTAVIGDRNPDAARLALATLDQIDRTSVPEQAPQAWQDVLAERRRQIMEEGFTGEHDGEHKRHEILRAAISYAMSAAAAFYSPNSEPPSWWPWERRWWKPKDPRRDLVRAGALILAEIERLDQAAGIAVPSPEDQGQ